MSTPTVESVPPPFAVGSTCGGSSSGSNAMMLMDKSLKHKRRYCRTAGCTNIVKSQGLCQRHGAKPRMCKVEGCSKQAQGNFDGMCKFHFKEDKLITTPLPPRPPAAATAAATAANHLRMPPPPPEGESVYERIIPASIGWNPSSGTIMPLISHLRQGSDDPAKQAAWHRNEERRARGLWPVHNPATQLESWERELVWTEILLLTGNPESSFRHLARGWGRDKGFHMVLAQYICERRGNVERKKRRKMANDAQAAAASNREGGDERTNVVGADLYDETVYSAAAYNEALAADLFDFDESPSSPSAAAIEQDNHHYSDRIFMFDDAVVSSDEGQEGSGSTTGSSDALEDPLPF